MAPGEIPASLHFATRVTLAVCVLVTLAGSGRAEERCGTCHPDVQQQFAQSVHAATATCTACHGGDPELLDVLAHSTEKGYRGKIERRAVPEVCASCHSDPERMRPFGLSTDQAAQYQVSDHGRSLAEGNVQAAVCTDCHGVHDVASRDEPTSPIFPQNVPATCGRCHSDRNLMAPYGVRTNQVEEFRNSAHGKSLFVDRHPLAPSCATCHGAHGAAAPGAGSIAAMCGHCHSRTREYFRQSPHAAAAAAGRMAECTSCHGDHDTASPGRSSFESCTTCHGQGSPGYAAMEQIKTLLSRTEEAIEASAAALDRARPTFPTLARYDARLEQARAYFLQALPLQHSLAVDRIEDLTRNARSVAEEVETAVHATEQQKQVRYLLLALIWVFVFLIAAVAHAYRSELRAARQASGASRAQPGE